MASARAVAARRKKAEQNARQRATRKGAIAARKAKGLARQRAGNMKLNIKGAKRAGRRAIAAGRSSMDAIKRHLASNTRAGKARTGAKIRRAAMKRHPRNPKNIAIQRKRAMAKVKRIKTKISADLKLKRSRLKPGQKLRVSTRMQSRGKLTSANRALRNVSATRKEKSLARAAKPKTRAGKIWKITSGKKREPAAVKKTDGKKSGGPASVKGTS